MEFDLENPLTACVEFQKDGVKALFENELDHLPAAAFFSDGCGVDDDIRFLIRREVFCFICHARYSYNLDSNMSYLAVNYADRFICRTDILRVQNMQQQKKRWMIVILAVSSLSLAAKMVNMDISTILYNILREENMDFDIPSRIQRMEMLILNTLNWRMRSITPFSFLNVFISLFEYEDAKLPHALKCCASHIIFNSHHEMKLLEYKPSVIGASAFLLATQELMPAKFLPFSVGVSACEYIHKEKLMKCLKIMQEALMEGCIEALTPTSVLDKPCQSYENRNCPTMSGRDNIKRRRVNDFYSDDADQIV